MWAQLFFTIFFSWRTELRNTGIWAMQTLSGVYGEWVKQDEQASLTLYYHTECGCKLAQCHWLGYLCCCSVTKLCPSLCYPMDCSTPGFPVLHHLPECAQTHVHWFGDASQPSHPLWPSSPLALNLSQHQSLFQWVSSLHQAAKVLELQLQHQSFQWMLCFLDLHIWSWFALSDHTLMLKCPEVPTSGAFLKHPSLP